MNYITVRVMFDSLDGAVEALILVLEHARETDKGYSFGPLSADQVFSSGLLLLGDAQEVLDILTELNGVEVYAE